MKKNKKDAFESLDDLFASIDTKSIVNSVVSGIDTVSKNIASSIDNSLKENGYDSVSEFFEGEIRDRKGRQPGMRRTRKICNSRKEYIENSLRNVDYDISFRGYYKQGHEEAMNNCLTLLTGFQNDYDGLAKRLQQEKREAMTELRRRNNKDAFTRGYIAGVDYAIKLISQSKTMMMQKIIQEVQ